MSLSSDLLNDEIIDQLKFISEDDADFVPQLIDVLEKEVLHFIDKLPEKIQSSDYLTIAKWAHKLIGASANLGAEKLSKLTRSLEEAAKASDGQTIKQLLPQMMPVFTQTAEQLKQLFGK